MFLPQQRTQILTRSHTILNQDGTRYVKQYESTIVCHMVWSHVVWLDKRGCSSFLCPQKDNFKQSTTKAGMIISWFSECMSGAATSGVRSGFALTAAEYNKTCVALNCIPHQVQANAIRVEQWVVPTTLLRGERIKKDLAVQDFAYTQEPLWKDYSRDQQGEVRCNVDVVVQEVYNPLALKKIDHLAGDALYCWNGWLGLKAPWKLAGWSVALAGAIENKKYYLQFLYVSLHFRPATTENCHHSMSARLRGFHDCFMKSSYIIVILCSGLQKIW